MIKKKVLLYIGIGIFLILGIIGFLLLTGKMEIKMLNPFSRGEVLGYAGSSNPSDNRTIGYEFLDDGKVVHIWNTQDDYYFNKSSGIQFTNHFQDYWTRNIFCIGYYNGTKWVKIRCADELENFNRNIQTDNETYVNATLWKDISYSSYDLRLGINYYLGLDDENLSITIYGKNIGINIPFDLGFAWKITDWDIPPRTHDFININNSNYLIHTFNGSIIFREMDNAFIKGYDNYNFLRLDWNENLDYAIKMFGNGTKESFYIALLINAGHFNPNQEKSTTFQWIDAIEVDDTSSGTDSGTDTLTVAHTATGTETNGILIVTVQVTDSTLTDRIIFNVSHNNEQLTHLPADSDDNIEQRTEIWYRVNPTTGGSPDIVVTAGGSCTDLSLGAISLTGVDTNVFDVIDEQITGTSSTAALYGGASPDWYSQSITGTGEPLRVVNFRLRNGGIAPTGTVVAKLYTHTGTYGTSSEPDSLLATSDTVDVASISELSHYIPFIFSTPYTLVSGTKYVIVIDGTNIVGNFENRLYLGQSLSDVHDGNRAYSNDGITWTPSATTDLNFQAHSASFNVKIGDSTPPTLNITTVGSSSYVIDSLAIAEPDGTKIANATGPAIHKTDVGGDTHASQYVDAGGAGLQVMNYSDVDQDKSWVMSAVAIQVLSEDTTPPYFTDGTPTNQTINNITALEYNINASDETALSCFTVNDTTNFAINCSGWLKNNTQLSVQLYNLNITINDTSNNENSTVMWVNVTGYVPPEDTCTYTSGDWDINCGDYCNITSAVEGDGSNLLVNGTGKFTMTANISGFAQYMIKDNCEVVCEAGGCFVF